MIAGWKRNDVWLFRMGKRSGLSSINLRLAAIYIRRDLRRNASGSPQTLQLERRSLSAQVSMFVGYDLAAALQSDLPYEQATDD